MGMHDQAAMIENQMKQNQPRVGGGTAAAANVTTSGSTPGQVPNAFSGNSFPPGATQGTQFAGYTGGQQQAFPQTGQFTTTQPQQF